MSEWERRLAQVLDLREERRRDQNPAWVPDPAEDPAPVLEPAE